MKTKLAAAAFLIGLTPSLMAQPTDQLRARQEQAPTPQSAEELAKQFDLTLDLANRAWELYTDYTETLKTKHQKNREAMQTMRTRGEKPSDVEAEKIFFAHLSSRREMLDYEEAQYKKFTEFLSPTQALRLMHEGRQAVRPSKHKARSARQVEPSETKTRY